MLLAMVFAASQDSLGKWLSLLYPVPLVIWARYMVHFLMVSVILSPRLPDMVRTRRPVLQILRSILLYMITVLFITALTRIQVTDGTAIMFIAPIIVTALSPALLGEKVGVRRWIGVAIGFLGALIVIRPGGGFTDWGALMALGAAFCYGLFQLSTRVINRDDHAMTTMFYTAVGGTVISSLVLPFYWVAPDPVHWPALIGMGIFGAATHFSLIRAFAHADAVVISPFGYTHLIWATGIAYVVFNEVPDGWTVIGALVIAGSGLYILYRERQRAKT